VINWYSNNVAKRKNPPGKKKADKMDFSVRDVVKITHREQIHALVAEHTNDGPGETDWLRNYPAALSRLMKGLSEEELADAQNTADQWANEGAPREVQRVYVSFIIWNVSIEPIVNL
jgi:hypothetical protein